MIKISSGEGREDCPQLKPKGTQASLGTTATAFSILLILSILLSYFEKIAHMSVVSVCMLQEPIKLKVL